MARESRRAPIAQVSRQGGPRPHRVAHLRGVGVGMADGHVDACVHQVLDELEAAEHLGRDGDEHDAALGRVLAAAEVLDRRRDDVRRRMRAPRLGR